MSIILVGGTSEIGNAVVRGLVSRSALGGEVTRISRQALTQPSSSSSSSELSVTFDAFWADPNHCDLVAKTRHLVLSVGSFKATEGESLNPGNLWEMIAVNARVNLDFLADFVAVFEAVRTGHDRVEVHFVSSVLADFSRHGSLDYSLSKDLVERKLIGWAQEGPDWLELFVWKPAYVDTKFHTIGRQVRGIRTSLGHIEAQVRRHRKPGIRYVPAWVGAPVKLLKVSPGLASLVSKVMTRIGNGG